MTEPLIIGHRGASAFAPENTLAAFDLALQQGADGIEFDVRLSRDGVPIVIHDANLIRTGLSDQKVAALTATELQQIDVGSWFSRRHGRSEATFSNERIPRLEQVLEMFSQRKALLYLEIKIGGEGARAAAEVVRAIRHWSVQEHTVVCSFDISVIESIKRRDDGIRTAALFEPQFSRPLEVIKQMRLLDVALRSHADEIALHHLLAGRRIIEKARHAGLEIVIWTVDRPKWIDRARAMDIKVLFTNDPAAMVLYRNQIAGHPPAV